MVQATDVLLSTSAVAEEHHDEHFHQVLEIKIEE